MDCDVYKYVYLYPVAIYIVTRYYIYHIVLSAVQYE